MCRISIARDKIIDTMILKRENTLVLGFLFFFELYAFIILTSTLVLGINYFVIITRPLGSNP